MSACEGGCIQGPLTGNTRLARFQSRVDLEESIRPIPAAEELLHFDTENLPSSKTFRDRSTQQVPSEEQIRKILEKTGKFSKEDELNCGACGYQTCREKAIAVFQDKAELSMCIPYMNEQAHSLANTILEASPNMTIIVDRDLKIREFSAAAEKHFHITRKKALETYLFELIDTDDFEWAFKYKQHVQNKKIEFPEYGFTALMRPGDLDRHHQGGAGRTAGLHEESGDCGDGTESDRQADDGRTADRGPIGRDHGRDQGDTHQHVQNASG